MESKMSKAMVLMSLLAVLIVSGCAAHNMVYKPWSVMSGGYAETKQSDGSWMVQFMGGQGELAMKGVYYRCAEFTFEQGKRYYRVLNAQDLGGVAHGEAMASGQRTGAYIGRGRYIIMLLDAKAEGKEVMDAYQILNTMPVPNTNTIRSVAERNNK